MRVWVLQISGEQCSQWGTDRFNISDAEQGLLFLRNIEKVYEVETEIKEEWVLEGKDL